MSNWFSGFIPIHREDMTIAEEILAQTAAMKKNGDFENMSLCWSPAALEKLAMFAIDAKYKLARISGHRRNRQRREEAVREFATVQREKLQGFATEFLDRQGDAENG